MNSVIIACCGVKNDISNYYDKNEFENLHLEFLDVNRKT